MQWLIANDINAKWPFVIVFIHTAHNAHYVIGWCAEPSQEEPNYPNARTSPVLKIYIFLLVDTRYCKWQLNFIHHNTSPCSLLRSFNNLTSLILNNYNIQVQHIPGVAKPHWFRYVSWLYDGNRKYHLQFFPRGDMINKVEMIN